VRPGWLRTGDLARCDADGYLYPEGRLSDTINRGGEKFGPTEIGDVLRSHPGVADVAVAGVTDPEMGERVGVAIVWRHPGPTPTLEELRDWCRPHLAPFKLPEVVVFVDALPYNELGKLSRKAAAELITSRVGTASS
jgi:long-chain acyl-CoA synthetase